MKSKILYLVTFQMRFGMLFGYMATESGNCFKNPVTKRTLVTIQTCVLFDVFADTLSLSSSSVYSPSKASRSISSSQRENPP
jgi:hypothetical protein